MRIYTNITGIMHRRSGSVSTNSNGFNMSSVGKETDYGMKISKSKSKELSTFRKGVIKLNI